MRYYCRACKKEISPSIDLGEMPLANGYLDKDQFELEYYYNLAAGICTNCSLFQIVECPNPSKVFNESYPHISGLSNYMTSHFKSLAEKLHIRYLKDATDPFVVEIGSNDGTFLKNFANWGINHLGIEPTKSVAEMALNVGVNTEICFFDEKNAKRIRKNKGSANIIYGANVIAHIEDINSVANGVRELLKDDGLFIFEAIYLGNVINNLSYDQIYDEHVYTFSSESVYNVFGLADLELIDLYSLPTQGGSMRYILAPKGSRPVKASVDQILRKENDEKLNSVETISEFAFRSIDAKDGLRSLVNNLKNDGKIIAGYGAATKSTIIINYCNFTSQEIKYIVDSTPLKQDKFSPGAHIPVYDPTIFRENPPDYALLFAWNHLDEIIKKESLFSDQGGKWILPIPLSNIPNDLPIIMPEMK